MKAKYLLILFTLIQFNWIRAQVSYNYKLYTAEDGLISNTCYKLFQDSKGYLWVANGNGVSRFNGKQFENIVDKNYKKGNWEIKQFVESKDKKNDLVVNSYSFKYDLNKKKYLLTDSALIYEVQIPDSGSVHQIIINSDYPSVAMLDKDQYKIYSLNKKSNISKDTIYYNYNGKYNFVVLPNEDNNENYKLLIDSKNNVYVIVYNQVKKIFSYYQFEKGKLNLLIKSKDPFYKIERDYLNNIICFFYDKGQCISFYDSNGKIIRNYTYDGLNSSWNDFECIIDRDNFVWIPTKKGILKVNGNSIAEYTDNNRNITKTPATEYGPDGSSYSFMKINDQNYKFIKKDGWGNLINGDRLFSGIKFYDLLDYYLINETAIATLKGGGINDVLCDRENNIWIATASGLVKFTPVPYRIPKKYLSKEYIGFELEFIDALGREFYVKKDESTRTFELKIIKDTLLLFTKTYQKTILNRVIAGLHEALSFFNFGKNSLMFYNSSTGKYKATIFDSKEVKTYEIDYNLDFKYGDSLNLIFMNGRGNLYKINSKSITKHQLNDFWGTKIRNYEKYTSGEEVIGKNRILGSNLTICQLNEDFSIDTFAYGNLPLAIRYSTGRFLKSNILNFNFAIYNKNGSLYLANPVSHIVINSPDTTILSKYFSSRLNSSFNISLFKDILLFSKNWSELIAFKYDSISKKMTYLNTYNISNGLLSMNDNLLYVCKNYLIIGSYGISHISIFSYNNFIKNGLNNPINIKVPSFDDDLVTDKQNYFETILTDKFFNRLPPLININSIIYSSGGKVFNDSINSFHNYSSSISNLTFNYDAVSLTEGDYIQTKYNVLGFDTTWQTIKTNDIVFSSLPAGSYTLQIKACNNHNYWSEPKQFSFTIDFPWYRTWLAYILYVVVGGGVIYLFIKSRTKKLEEEKENLEKIVEERTAEVVEEKKVITEQKHLIEEKHREITDSINYAERIQRSFLATKEQLDNNLSDYFILFKPKDVVSGDFYWSHTLQNGNFALVTADSTGHGVPGAIMSLLNTSSIERAVELGISEPAEILNHTRQTIIERLKKDGSAEGGKDGMDCSLISFNKEKSKFAYAAANNPIWIIRNKELIELAPDKIPVGKHDRDSVSFTQHEVEIQKGDMIYTLTDGFPDQFGGPKGKKFMYKKLKEMLITIAHKPTAEQQTVLKGTLKDWMGNTEQVDDVTIIGVRV